MFTDSYCAIPSWYGYVFQGHTAIDITLKRIERIINEDMIYNGICEIADFKSVEDLLIPYELELEWMEDFSYKFNGEYFEFHQVKASDEVIKIENSALFDLIFKLRENCNEIIINRETKNVKGFFHLADEKIILPSSNDIVKSLSDLMKDLKQELDEIVGMNFDEKLKILKSTKGRKKHSLRKAIYSDKNKIDLDKCDEEGLNEYLNSFNDKIISMTLTEEEINRIEILISKPCYSSIEEIENSIADTICIITNKIKTVKNVVDEEFTKKYITPKIVQFITEHIDGRKKNLVKREIEFKKIIDLLQEAINHKDSELYSIYKYRQDIANGLNNFIEYECEQEMENCYDCNEKEQCNLYEFWNQFLKAPIDNVLSLIKNINFTDDISKGCHQYPDEGCLHDTLFKYIKEINLMKYNETHVSARKNNKNYWCTSYNKSYDRKRFTHELEKNKINILELLFEADVLISKNSPLTIIEFGRGKIIDISGKDLQEVKNNDTNKKYFDKAKNIITPKNIRIIELSDAKGELE